MLLEGCGGQEGGVGVRVVQTRRWSRRSEGRRGGGRLGRGKVRSGAGAGVHVSSERRDPSPVSVCPSAGGGTEARVVIEAAAGGGRRAS